MLFLPTVTLQWLLLFSIKERKNERKGHVLYFKVTSRKIFRLSVWNLSSYAVRSIVVQQCCFSNRRWTTYEYFGIVSLGLVWHEYNVCSCPRLFSSKLTRYIASSPSHTQSYGLLATGSEKRENCIVCLLWIRTPAFVTLRAFDMFSAMLTVFWIPIFCVFG